MARTVAILGGGVAGLSAAHELAERGYQVDVYEAKAAAGGKARSIFVEGTGSGGRRGLPGEHGFRFFPSFYKHLPDTMKRIPFPGKALGVYDNLVGTNRTLIARQEPAEEISVIAHFPRSRSDLKSALEVLRADLGIPLRDMLFFQQRVLVLLTSSDARRLGEYERLPWWKFIEAERRSPKYAEYFGEVAVRFLVAMSPRRASTRTVGNIGLQLSLGHFNPMADVDRLLDGPTEDVWIRPWYEYLERIGVTIHREHAARKLTCEGGRIQSVELDTPEGPKTVDADYYVAAVPAERMVELTNDAMVAAEPSLSRIEQLTSDWMIGIQFFLKRDVQLASGHIVFVDAPWALTAISQAQFWSGTDMAEFGDGTVRGVLSVVISNWHAAGDVNGKAAKDCTPEEIKEEVWREVKDHLNDMGEVLLSDDDLVDWYLADSVRFTEDGAVNDEPLLINTVDSWSNRPEAVTGIPNFFLASDYVRTNTDLATMEAANEAARRAVNGVLDADRSTMHRCRIWDLVEPWWFKPMIALDRWRFDRGKPHLFFRGGR